MEDLELDAGSILSAEEADKFFDVQEQDAPEEEEKETKETEKENEPAEEDEQAQTPESVGEEEKSENGANAINTEDDGSSPSIYSSIAKALVDDGIFSDFEDKELEKVNTPEDFADLFEKTISDKMDQRTRRVYDALNYGVKPDTVRMYEQTLQYLGSINDEVLSSEGEDGDDLRKQLIFNDLINRGYSEDKANREVEKSFKSGSDIDDAKDALEALRNYYSAGYKKVQDDAKAEVEAKKKAMQENSDKFRKMILDDDLSFGETKLDKRTCQRVYDAVMKPAYKDENGNLLTEVQKFQKEHPLEFMKQLGMWFVLTDGGKSTEKLTKEQLRVEKNKGIKELSRKINSSSINSDGSLRYTSRTSANNDPLLSDGWDVDM